ncbi:hypothetical protein Ancab_016866 [Ancistrocladus abbreviatus]
MENRGYALWQHSKPYVQEDSQFAPNLKLSIHGSSYSRFPVGRMNSPNSKSIHVEPGRISPLKLIPVLGFTVNGQI